MLPSASDAGGALGVAPVGRPAEERAAERVEREQLAQGRRDRLAPQHPDGPGLVPDLTHTAAGTRALGAGERFPKPPDDGVLIQRPQPGTDQEKESGEALLILGLDQLVARARPAKRPG